jgi:hypothetical protein
MRMRIHVLHAHPAWPACEREQGRLPAGDSLIMDKVMSYLPTGNRPHVAIWLQAELDAKFSESKDVLRLHLQSH